MVPNRFRFGRFHLNCLDRQLRQDGVPVELNARYLDALALLVRQAGKLVSKDRFLNEVWRGVPVTDEALTQCIKTLRRQLGDQAARPRFIETVPKHGYRFVAAVELLDEESDTRAATSSAAAMEVPPSSLWRQFFLLGGAGTLGAGIAGVVGGLFYGSMAASHPIADGMGAASVLLVILWLTIAAAVMGGAGVSFGIAGSGFASERASASIVGGALGGLVVGGVVKLLGLDAFNLLLGRSPGDITGGLEGVLLGGAVGIGVWLGHGGSNRRSAKHCVAWAGLTGGASGIVISLLGGRLMGGSLDLLARGFPDSRLRLDSLGEVLGDDGFGPFSKLLMSGLEGALFAGCIVGAMSLARRSSSFDR